MAYHFLTSKKYIAVFVTAVCLFAIATLGAKSINSHSLTANGNDVSMQAESSIAPIEDSSFESTLNNLSTKLYSWTARNPEDNEY